MLIVSMLLIGKPFRVQHNMLHYKYMLIYNIYICLKGTVFVQQDLFSRTQVANTTWQNIIKLNIK